MPTKYEIYEGFASEYDEFVSHGDYEGNLKQSLGSCFDFRNKSVYEFGVGTGRVTSLYVDLAKESKCFDRSEHMMARAKQNLKDFKSKATFEKCDNLQIDLLAPGADCVIEGWSFVHTVGKFEEIERVVSKIVHDCSRLLNENGQMIFIESLGTNTSEPAAPSIKTKKFYELLEGEYKFRRTVVRTDYRFDSVEDATRIFSFFFGDVVSKGIQEKNLKVIPEFTGIWMRGKF
ncbi:MAG: class I SAM-dependent methyltransferase [Desulfuromonadaceae bacterium]